MATIPQQLIDNLNAELEAGECLDGPGLAAAIGSLFTWACDNFTTQVVLEDGVPTDGGTFTGCVEFEGDCSGGNNPVTHDQLAAILANQNNTTPIQTCPPDGQVSGPVPGPNDPQKSQVGCKAVTADASGNYALAVNFPSPFAALYSVVTNIGFVSTPSGNGFTVSGSGAQPNQTFNIYYQAVGAP